MANGFTEDQKKAIEALDKSGDSHSVTAGQLDDLRMSLEDFITGVKKLKV